MSASNEHGTGYVVPAYRAGDDAVWYHFLHGNVPGHQIDFMYRAEVPQGLFTRQHFSHLSRLMKYIEPQAGNSYAFAIGNLSRDDTQHEPGHGGFALIFGMRIQGVTDHAGRQDPPFAHGIATVDRELSRQEVLATAGVFHRHVLAAAQSADWYRSYVRCLTEGTGNIASIFEDYIKSFSDLPEPEPSSLDLRWTVRASTPPRRVVIVHDDDAPFGQIAACAAKIASVLYPSDIRWSAISNGREADLPNGVTVRFVAERNLSAADQETKPHLLDAVPDDEEEIAKKLFGASSASVAAPVARGWRERFSAVPDPSMSIDTGSGERSSWEGQAPPARTGASSLQSRPSPADFDAAATKVWDRPPGADTAADVEIDVEPPVADGAIKTLAAEMAPAPAGNVLPFVSPSARPPPMDALEPAGLVEHAAQAPEDRRETQVISAEEARRAIEAASLPFKPKTAAQAQAAKVATSSEWEPTPDFRRSSAAFPTRWIILSVGIAGALIAVMYLLLSGDDGGPPPSGSASAIPSSTSVAIATSTSEPPPASAAPSAPNAATARPVASAEPPSKATSQPKPPSSIKPRATGPAKTSAPPGPIDIFGEQLIPAPKKSP